MKTNYKIAIALASAFRLSTITVSMSLTGSCFSLESR
jgi:hypothetical protein